MTDANSSEPNSLQNSWILVNHVEEAEEATALDQEEEKKDSVIESDAESDSISVISDTQVNDSNTEDENATIKEQLEENPKWTFIEDSSESSAQKFYLNCMQEPVQELSEQELGSLHSDLEIESDGISIISDTDDYLDSNEPVMENAVHSLEKNRSDWWDIKKYCGNFVLMSTVSIAVLSIFLSPYFNNTVINEDDIIMYEKDIEMNNYDPLVYCQEKHKKDGIYREMNIKKCKRCLNRVGRNNEKKNKNKNKNGTLNEKELKIKEEYLKQKEEFLIKKEHELNKAEIKLKNMQNTDKKAHKIKDDIPQIQKIEKPNRKRFKRDTITPKQEKYKSYLEKNKSYLEKNKSFKEKTKIKYPEYAHVKENKSNEGYWYTDIGKNRLNIRKTERQGEWVFDRAGLRKKNRKIFKFRDNKLNVVEKVKKFLKNYY